MKKLLTVIKVIIAVIVVIWALIAVPMKINDFLLVGFTEDVIDGLKMPENTVMVEYISECGNSSGTGDHTDLYVVVLIESDLDYVTLAEHFKEDEHFWRMQNVKEHGEHTIGMGCMGLKFETEFDEPDKYFILEYNKSAMLDFRGW